jgi:hypothetical protein
MALSFNSEKLDSSLNTYREIFSDPLKSGDDNSFTGDVILPLDFSLEMDGISGIIPHSAFTIPENSLPKSYIIQSGSDAGKSKIAFILHTIDQNFNNNKWTTKITGQTLNIRFEPLTEAEKNAIKSAKEKQTSMTKFQNYGTSSTSSSKNKQDAYDKAEIQYPGFKAKTKQVASAIGVSEMDLVTVMYKESRITPSVRNSIGCVGLIQFCPDVKRGNTKTIIETYKQNGKTQHKQVTYNLSSVQNMGLNQLDLVEKYFKSLGFNSNKFSTAMDLYGATFYPISRNKPKDWVYGSEKGKDYALKVANQNPAITAFSTKFIDGQRVIDGYAFERYVNS